MNHLGRSTSWNFLFCNKNTLKLREGECETIRDFKVETKEERKRVALAFPSDKFERE